MNLEIEAMALEMPRVAKHPNRLPFHGVLTLVGKASQRPPSGARGHRVMLTRKASEVALPSLLGMALDYAPALDSHDARRKIGVITEAEIVEKGESAQGLKPGCLEGLAARLKSCPDTKQVETRGADPESDGAAEDAHLQKDGAQRGYRPLARSSIDETERLEPAAISRNEDAPKGAPLQHGSSAASGSSSAGEIAISGYLYAHDFPEVVEELRAGHGSLGMSYEITEAFVVSPGSPVWTVTSFTFTGAAVLRREKAAYPETWIAIQ